MYTGIDDNVAVAEAGGVATTASETAGAREAGVAEHLAPLTGGQWAMWRWIGLRGAGFPADDVLRFALPNCEAADNLLRDEDAEAEARAHVLRSLSEALDALKLEGRWEEEGARSALVKMIREVKKGKTPKAGVAPAAVDEAVGHWVAARERVEASRAEFREAFEEGAEHVSAAVREVASDALFREAVAWQNRHALRGSIGALLEMSPEEAGSRKSDRRRREELIASYVQRYCTKNDTIGFFGPVGWAKLVPHDVLADVRPGARLLAERNVYFEPWCIDALITRLVKDKALRPWLVPHRSPTIDVRGDTLYRPPRGPVKISKREALLIGACAQGRTAREVARELVAAAPEELPNEEAVFYLLSDLSNKGLISWGLDLPITLRPEVSLRRLLERIEDEELRARALEPLEQLEEARRRVAEAAGDSEKLDRAIGELEATFKRLTGVNPTRSGGELYAGRTLVFEDCRRDIEVEFGPEFVDSLSAPLSLLLTAARWFTYQVSEICRAIFDEMYRGLVISSGSATVEFVQLWSQVRPLMESSSKPPVDELLARFQRLWADILRVPEGQGRVEYTSDELRERVHATFDAPHAGWNYARQHSPDLMIAAESAEALRRGDYHFVLGEMHMGANTLSFPVFLAQHPAPEELERGIAHDFTVPRLIPILTKHFAPEQTARVFYALFSPDDVHIEFAPVAPDGTRPTRVPVGSLVVERKAGRLVVRTRDGGMQFDLLAAFGTNLSDLVVDYLKILTPARHTPRVTIDRLVACREAWRFKTPELSFAFVKDETERFIAARRWARANGLPRFMFAKVPVEKKPFFLDMDSQLFVELFARTVRRSVEAGFDDATFTLSEMVPDFNHTWLPDAEGRRYTCELRSVAVDLGPGPHDPSENTDTD
jgi:hypothetical protein